MGQTSIKWNASSIILQVIHLHLRFSSAIGLGFTHLPVSINNLRAAVRSLVNAILNFTTELLSKYDL